MATAVRVASVAVPALDNSTHTQPAVVVGGDQAWSDDTDATWVEYPVVNAAGDQATAYGDFPKIAVAGNSWHVSIRAEALNPNAAASVNLFATDGSFTNVWTANLTASGVAWYDLPGATYEGSYLEAGVRVSIINQNTVIPTGPNADDFRVYEVILWIDGATGIPPLRQLPRDDWLGTGSAARIWPPPSSEQGGLRRLGYY